MIRRVERLQDRVMRATFDADRQLRAQAREHGFRAERVRLESALCAFAEQFGAVIPGARSPLARLQAERGWIGAARPLPWASLGIRRRPEPRLRSFAGLLFRPAPSDQTRGGRMPKP